MAITATIVYSGHTRIRYFVNSTAAAESISIPSVGGATPDLATDSLAGPVHSIATVKANGYGLIPVGGLGVGGVNATLQAQALLLSQSSAVYVGPGIPTAIARIEPVTGGVGWLVSAVPGPGDTATPGLSITNSSGGAASAYVTLEVPGAIGA